MLAFGLGLPSGLEDVPAFLSAIFILFGVVMLLASMSHARLRWRRHLAYNGGREKDGTLTVECYQGEDEDTARVLFASGKRKWRMTVDASSLPRSNRTLGEPCNARAWLGEDGCVYAINIGEKELLPISSGVETNDATGPRILRADA